MIVIPYSFNQPIESFISQVAAGPTDLLLVGGRDLKIDAVAFDELDKARCGFLFTFAQLKCAYEVGFCDSPR